MARYVSKSYETLVLSDTSRKLCGLGTRPFTTRDRVLPSDHYLLCTRSAFCVDDSQNQPLADWYGVVMGTSHEEPFMRSVPVEWDLFGSGAWDYNTNRENVYEFWREGAERARGLESVYTIGMRGAGECRGSIFDG